MGKHNSWSELATMNIVEIYQANHTIDAHAAASRRAQRKAEARAKAKAKGR